MNRIKKNIFNNRRKILTFILVTVFLINLSNINGNGGMFHTGGYRTLKAMFSSLLSPDLSIDIIILALISCWKTFTYALMSISLALLVAFPLGVLASGIIFSNKYIILLTRGIIGFLRAIHELIWAWIFVAAVGLNPVGAVFALAIPYAGYLGKIFADILKETPQFPVTALKISGAGKFQTLFYGYLPLAFPNMFSYTMYRLECAVRSSSVLSFIGLGGIGFQIQLSLQDLKYSQVWTFMFFLIMMILGIDKWGYEIRRRIG
ncbi:ABC transporter permease [Leptotrichia sp. OH3620_COT-345]|uniref:PhnE/PtxC family ABC transporter permease n=1 Tax=Leptotrichia sp. OH3620_COT-345 TaxID=2491048 RepID=UPI0018F547C5|nr:ABC transporter permease subunit [Leptotrichia sp. OH3620_COT-345]